MKKDIKFDYIRTVAMSMIVLCHFCQIIGLVKMSTWLNVGVQVFFVLSAKLLANKNFDSCTEIGGFLKSRILRIFIPVWIYLFALVPVLYVVGRGPEIISLVLYCIGLAGFTTSGVLGLGHFWYISVLLICYVIVPVLYKISKHCEEKGKLQSFLIKSIVPLIAIVSFLFIKNKHYGINIALFCFAYFFFRQEKSNPDWYKGKAVKLFPIALVFSVVRLFADTTGVVSNAYYDGVFVALSKVFFGAFLFFFIYEILSRTNARESRIIKFISNASYEIYIVHQFVLLALYEFISFFQNGVVGKTAFFVCAMAVIVINAVVVYYIKLFIEKKVLKK